MDKENKPLDWVKVIEARNFGLNFVPDGGIKQVEVNRHSICLVRKGEELYAVRARCPHSGGPFVKGRLAENGDLECPWHRYKFCLESGKNTSGEGYHLPTYPLDLRRNGLYIGFEQRKPWWMIW